MIKLRNVDAASLVSMIQPMISRDGLVAAFPETNTLIITDDAWNVQRLLADYRQPRLAAYPAVGGGDSARLAYADDLAPEDRANHGWTGAPPPAPRGFRPMPVYGGGRPGLSARPL